jgi:hypothetical protein
VSQSRHGGGRGRTSRQESALEYVACKQACGGGVSSAAGGVGWDVQFWVTGPRVPVFRLPVGERVALWARNGSLGVTFGTLA